MSSPKKKAVRLTQENLIRLSDWMKEHKASLEEMRHSYKEIAAKASAELGFPIADNSIYRMGKMLGIDIKLLQQGGGVAYKEKIKVSKKKIEILRDNLVLLYAAVGSDTPEELGVNWPAE